METSPISDVQITNDQEVEKYLIFYGYKKVNQEINGKHIYYCRGCTGPYYIKDIEIKKGGLAEILAEVSCEDRTGDDNEVENLKS